MRFDKAIAWLAGTRRFRRAGLVAGESNALPASGLDQGKRKRWRLRLRRCLIAAPLILVLMFAVAPPASAAPATLDEYCTIDPDEFDLFGCFLSKTIDPLRHGMVWILDGMNTEEPDLFGNFFEGYYSLTLRLGLMVTVPMVLLSTLAALLKGGTHEVIRTYLVGLPVSILGAVAGIGFISVLQKFNQRISDWFWPQLNADLRTWVNTLLSFDSAAVALMSAILMMIIMIGIMMMSWGMYNEMLFRVLMIYLVLLFFPIALAVWIFRSTRRWATFALEFVVVMVFAKSVMIIILSFGFHLLVVTMGPDVWADGRGFVYGVMGLSLMVMAALSMPAMIAYLLQPRHQPQMSRQGFYAKDAPTAIPKRDMYRSAAQYPRRWFS